MASPPHPPSPFPCSLSLSPCFFHTLFRSSSSAVEAKYSSKPTPPPSPSQRVSDHCNVTAIALSTLNVSVSKAPSSTLSISLATRRALCVVRPRRAREGVIRFTVGHSWGGYSDQVPISGSRSLSVLSHGGLTTI